MAQKLGHFDCWVNEASMYAWGRSDGGDNLDAGDILDFGIEWACLKSEFAQEKRVCIPSLTSLYEQTFHGPEKGE